MKDYLETTWDKRDMPNVCQVPNDGLSGLTGYGAPFRILQTDRQTGKLTDRQTDNYIPARLKVDKLRAEHQPHSTIELILVKMLLPPLLGKITPHP